MILVAGQAIYDFFEQSHKRAVVNFTACPGGAPFNVAVALARLGISTRFLGALSRDVMGERLAAALREEGVDVRFVKRTALPTALAVVGVNRNGIPAFSFYGDKPAHCDLTLDDLPSVDETVKAIYVGCFPLVQEPVGTTLLNLIQREHTRRVIAYDPNVRLSIAPEIGLWRKRFHAFGGLADIIKVSSEDFAALYPNERPEVAARNWLGNGASLVLFTFGEKGARLFGRNGDVRYTPPPVMVQDTVGAGDTSMAAMLRWLYHHDLLDKQKLAAVRKQELQTMLEFSCIAASITCTRIGADPPTCAEIEAF